MEAHSDASAGLHRACPRDSIYMLPTELISEIVSYTPYLRPCLRCHPGVKICSSPPHFDFCGTSVRVCTLVSRVFREIAMPLLFSRALVYGYQGLHQFARILHARQDLASAVRTLTVLTGDKRMGDGSVTKEGNDEAFLKGTVDLVPWAALRIPTLPKCTVLQVEPYWPRHSQSEACRYPSLSELLRWVDSCPAITTLRLTELEDSMADGVDGLIDFDGFGAELEHSKWPTTLDIGRMQGLISQKALLLWKQFSPTIERLRVLAPTENSVVVPHMLRLAGVLPQLRSLFLLGRRQTRDDFGIRSLFRCFPNLEDLACVAPSGFGLDADCRCLTRLSLHVCFGDGGSTEKLFLSAIVDEITARRFPVLERLMLHGADNYEAQFTNNFVGLEQLVETSRLPGVCKSNGIELEVHDIDERPFTTEKGRGWYHDCESTQAHDQRCDIVTP